jgi:Tfp pilus assembly protein PilO
VTKNPKLLIAVVALVAAAGAYWMLVLSPKRAELAKLDTDLVAAQGELSSAQATLGTYEKAQGAYRRNYATVVRLGKAVPADDDVRSLVVQLDSAAEKSGVDFDRIAIGESGATGPTVASDPAGTTPAPPGAVSVGPAGFTAMPFSFAFNGDFDNLSTFFSRLERFVTVSEIGASSYLLPSSEGVTAGGTATAPAATTTTASATPSGTTPPTTTATSTGATIR